jgi:hypothetical protein
MYILILIYSWTVLHYGQEVYSGQFRAFDHGKAENLKVYGQPEPPIYRPEVIKTPVATYWSQNDMLCETSVSEKFKAMLQ